MNCVDWEERIALYAGGDLAGQAMEVERHLKECAGCREFSRGLTESLGLLKDIHEEALAPAHFAMVRARVLGELERRQWVWRRGWAWGLAGAALVLVSVVVGLRTGTEARIEPPVVALRTPGPPPEAFLKGTNKVVVARRKTQARAQGAPPVPQKTERLVIKLITDNPDVVIYWIADKRGDD